MDTLRAIWMPIYIEPLPFSGERLCSAIAFKAVNGEYKVISTLASRMLDCLFGADAPSMARLGAKIIESLDQHLKRKGDLRAWQPPFDGVEAGRIGEAEETGWGALIASVTNNIACMAAADDEKKEVEDAAITAWARAVEKIVVERDKNLRGHFKVPIQFGKGSGFTLGFVSSKLAAEFAVINPEASWGSQSTTFMRRVMHLATARKHAGLFTIPHPDILVRIPKVEEMTELSRQRFSALLIDAERMADSAEIMMRSYSIPAQAAEYILQNG